MQPVNLNKDKFNFSYPEVGKKEHVINWYVNRNKSIRLEMKKMWGNGENILNRKTMEGANDDQRMVKIINVLFRNMENFGPIRKEFGHFKHDSKNDMYHCHVWEKGFTYVIMWEVDEEKKIINIVDMAVHENFKFKRSHKKIESIAKAELNRSHDLKYQDNLRRRILRNE